MKHVEKDLLLKYLCMALPYGVIVVTPKGNGHLCSINQTIFGNEYGINIKAIQRDYFNDREYDIKPYLRPMSSMTEEEIFEFIQIYDSVLRIGERKSTCILSLEQMNWLLEHHFDFMGLIPKGLAIEVTKDDNPYYERNM